MAIRDLWEEWERKLARAEASGKPLPNRPLKRWMADTYVLGRRQFKAFVKKGQAEAWVARQKTLEINGQLGVEEKRKIGFAPLTRRFLEEKQAQRSRRTFEHYLHQIRPHLAPFFGDVPIDQITRERVVRYIHQRLGGRLGRRAAVHPRTVNKEIATLKRLLKYAQQCGYYLPNDPTAGVSAIKSSPKKMIRFLTDAEVDRFLAVCSGAALTFYLTAFDTGMRKNELFHFRWDWVDWDRDVIRVKQRGQFHTKSHEERDIPMTARLRAHLENLAVPRDGRVLPSRGVADSSAPGVRAGFRYLLKTLPALIRKAGLEHFTLHDARHTYASRLVTRGAPLYTVAKLLGHKDVKTTQIYAHLAPEHLKDAVRLLDGPRAVPAPQPPSDLGK